MNAYKRFLSSGRLYVIDPITISVVLVVVGTLVPSSRPWNWFKKGPAEKTAIAVDEVKKLEAARAEAQARADTLQAEKDRATQKAQEQKDRQLGKAQELTYGAATALSRVASPTIEVRTASTMLQHALVYQSLALGDLSPEQKGEVIKLIDLAAAGREIEFKEALAKKDAEVATAQREKGAALEQVKTATTQLANAQEAIGTISTHLNTKVQEADTFAKAASAQEKKANSFSTQVSQLIRWVIYAAVAYVLIVYVLPIVSLAFPQLRVLSKLSGWLAAPFHQLETSRKETLAVDLAGAHEDGKAWIEANFGKDARERYKKEVLSQWVTAKDGTARAVEELKASKLFKVRSQ